MAGVNKVILVGNLGTDPEIRNLESGAKLARLRVATSESYTNKAGERVEQTEWHTVILWRGLADVAEKYLSKGKQVYIEGKLKTRQWQDKDGQDRYSTEVEGTDMQMLGRPSREEGGSKSSFGSGSGVSTAAATSSDESDDLPF